MEHIKLMDLLNEVVDETIETLNEDPVSTAIGAGLGIWRGLKGVKRADRADRASKGKLSTKDWAKEFGKGVLGLKDKNKWMDSDVKIKNPKTGKEILATTAYSAGPKHPAYAAAKAALKIK